MIDCVYDWSVCNADHPDGCDIVYLEQTGGGYICSLIIKPSLMELGALHDEFLNFKIFDYDGEYSRDLLRDLIGRIGIEAIFILLEIICESANNTVRPWCGIDSLIKAFMVWFVRGMLGIGKKRTLECERLTGSGGHLRKLIEKYLW